MTWDDPGNALPGQGEPQSGNEGYEFFCLNAAAMIPVNSHSYADGTQEGTHAADCTSMDANYFIHEGLWKSFSDGYGPYVSQIQNAFDEKKSFAKEIPSYAYYIENGKSTWTYFYPSVVREILKAGLPKSISVQAFYHQGATTIILPKGCGTIGSKAFADSAVRTVVIPGPVTTIADDAFEGCTDILFISSDETVKTFATKHGFVVAAP